MDGISLDIRAGEILGLLGENGAGKSTLMKIVSGSHRPDLGEIALNGRPARFQNPGEALREGIGMLYQDPRDFPSMSVIDNLAVGSTGRLSAARKDLKRALAEAKERFGFTCDPGARVGALTMGERQQVEIVRLLWAGASTLVLDEPTTGVSPSQKGCLFAALRAMASQGMAVVLVSHKLPDVRDLCSRAAVLRRGKLVSTMDRPFDENALMEWMFGKVPSQGKRDAPAPGKTSMKIQSVTARERGLRVEGFSLDLREGEVVGLAGLSGNGQELLLKVCGGAVRPLSGSVVVGGADMSGKTRSRFFHAGVSRVPAARMEEGLLPGMTLAEHAALACDKVPFFLRGRWKDREARERISKLGVQGTPSGLPENLSGGNQQRFMLSLVRERAKILLLEHPTRGLDIESSFAIWKRIRDRCLSGAAVLCVSSDLDELLRECDRVFVFSAGRFSPPLSGTSLTPEALGLWMSGGVAQ